MDPNMLEHLKRNQAAIIGPRETRDIFKLPFENHWRIDRAKLKDRCIGFTLNVETPRGTGAPAALSRVDDSTILDEQLVTQKELAEVCISHIWLAPSHLIS